MLLGLGCDRAKCGVSGSGLCGWIGLSLEGPSVDGYDTLVCCYCERLA